MLEFYKWFNEIAPNLGERELSFKKIFKYLDTISTPITIIETGCLRKHGNYLDGQSTLLFDKYTLFRGNKSKVYTVDISPEATKICKETVSGNVEITTDDSVHYLNSICNEFLKNKVKASMLYLDSFDLDWRYPYPSAAHHLKELTSISRLLNEKTLVVVDDSPASGNLTQSTSENKKQWEIISSSPSPPPTIGGKGFLVHEYASHVEAKLLFSHYQSAWNNFNKE